MIKQISEDSILEILKALSVSEDEYKSKRESLKDTLSVAIINCMNGLLLYLKGDFTQSLNYFRDSEILLKTANVDVEVIFYNLILGYDMHGKICMVIGNGEMGKLAAQTLKEAFMKGVGDGGFDY